MGDGHRLSLLTPVPLRHLTSGEAVCRREGRVAFGSSAWERLRPIEAGTAVLIYASHGDDAAKRREESVSWVARYIRYLDSNLGAHPDGDRYRPTTCIEDGEDRTANWPGFYEVSQLLELPKEDRIHIADLADQHGKGYPRGFVPEGPILVQEPGGLWDAFRGYRTSFRSISLTRGMCFGTCPVYSVTLRADGTATWNGEAFVDRLGEFRGEFWEGEFDRLARFIQRSGFFDWHDEYAEAVTDNPTYTIEVERDGRSKRVLQYATDEPSDFWVIGRLIDSIAAEATWTLVRPHVGPVPEID